MRKLIGVAHALALVACGANAAEHDASAEASQSAGPGVFPTAEPRLTGTVAQRVLGVPEDTPLARVDACVIDPDNPLCAESAADGSYSLGPLAANSRFTVRYAAAGFAPLIIEQEIHQHSLLSDVFLVSESAAASIAQARGAQHDAVRTAGLIVVTHFAGYDGITPLANVTARFDNGMSLVYADAENQIDSELSSTSSSAWAAAFGVQPGPLELELSHSSGELRCGRIGIGSVLEGPVHVDLAAGSATLLNVYCVNRPGSAEQL